jgi:hypothetical protein
VRVLTPTRFRGLDDDALGSSCAYQLSLCGHLFVPRRVALSVSILSQSPRGLINKYNAPRTAWGKSSPAHRNIGRDVA